MNLMKLWCFAVTLGIFCVNITAREPLTLEQRVKAQEAIEKVYYNHRIWPKENKSPKPAFEKMVSKETIEAKVTDYLKKSAALEKFWYRPITGEQLQAEMDRMAKGTKDPATLNELFKALNDDPYLIAECLARPVLADRLIRNWYANDERFHKETREKAEEALKHLTPENFCGYPEGQYSRMTYRLEMPGSEPEMERLDPEDHSIKLPEKEFTKMFQEIPEEGKISGVIEKDDCFVILHTIEKNEGEMVVEELRYKKRGVKNALIEPMNTIPELISIQPTAFIFPTLSAVPCEGEWDNQILDNIPDWRRYHTAVWAGSCMIVWGGQGIFGYPSGGWKYFPATDAWCPTSSGSNCPEGRIYHTSVWTGSTMIVWGGKDATQMYNSGGKYDPETDSWTITSVGDNVPEARIEHSSVWTGSEMIVWGGSIANPPYVLNNGGKYNPISDSWTPINNGTNCPSARSGHKAFWTGTEMLVWGGHYIYNYFVSGGRYNPMTDSWEVMAVDLNTPQGREEFSAVWTGSEMIIWGGSYDDGSIHYLNTGARYSPAGNSWQRTSTSDPCPLPRNRHTAVWTGNEMIIWGGYQNTSPFFVNSGAKYDPSSDLWTSIIAGSGCPLARSSHTAVWTGSEMIVWGGNRETGWLYNSGGRYNPQTDSWVPTAAGFPVERIYHCAIWTGVEMIIWGGWDQIQYLADGRRYNPALDNWSSVSSGLNEPEPRITKAVWTGVEMIIWGGVSNVQSFNSGGKYNPDTDSWEATSLTNAPCARSNHTLIWSGSEMIVWGGSYYNDMTVYLNTGGRYNPLTDLWVATSTGDNAPSSRSEHSSVWTGTEMIIWGGYYNVEVTPTYYNTGSRYNPLNDSWVQTSTGDNVPTGRTKHGSVWTGDEMIVWGGEDAEGFMDLNSGGRYDPMNDSWTITSTGENAPTGRKSFSMIWTGNEVVIWGGYRYGSLSDGFKYNPLSDSWTVTSLSEVPLARNQHSALWTGNSMVIWGGYYCSGGSMCTNYYHKSGGILRLQTYNSQLSFSEIACNRITIDWEPVEMALSYDLYRMPGTECSGAQKINAQPILETIFQDTGLAIDSYYSYYLTCTTSCGTYRVPGCYSVSTSSATPLIVGSLINICPSSSVSLSIPASYATYQWNLNGSPISGANSNFYAATASGSYTVSVTDSNGCSGTSDPHVVTITPCIPNIVYQSHGTFSQVTGDGDSYFERGEKWSVLVTVTNSGNTPANNVTAVFSGNGITVCSATGSFGTIAAGGTGTFTYSFVIDDDFTPCGGNISFNLGSKVCTELTPAGADETNLFSIQVGQIAAGVPTDLVLQPSTADSYVNQASAGSNYGTAAAMYIQARTSQARRTLVQFDVSSVPSGSTINSATLELYATAVTGGLTLNAHRITGAWTETGVTWTNQPAYNSTADASIAGGTGTGWKIWNVASVVQQWVGGTANYGLVVKASTETGLSATTYTFASKEYATTTYRPILRINYTPPTTINCDYVGSGICSVPLPGECAPGDTYENGQTWSGMTQSWPALTGATGYKLYRGVLGGLPNLLTADPDSCLRYQGSGTSIDLSADDPSSETGRLYWYIVVGTNSSGEGPAGNGRMVNGSGNCE